MTGWLSNWLTETLGLSRHSRHSGSRRALGHSGTQGAWALGNLWHSGTRRALWHLGTQGTWALKALGHLAFQALERHLGTQTLGNLALEALYLADSISMRCENIFWYQRFVLHCIWYSDSNMSTRSTPPMSLLYWWTIWGHEKFFLTFSFEHLFPTP